MHTGALRFKIEPASKKRPVNAMQSRKSNSPVCSEGRQFQARQRVNNWLPAPRAATYSPATFRSLTLERHVRKIDPAHERAAVVAQASIVVRKRSFSMISLAASFIRSHTRS